MIQWLIDWLIDVCKTEADSTDRLFEEIDLYLCDHMRSYSNFSYYHSLYFHKHTTSSILGFVLKTSITQLFYTKFIMTNLSTKLIIIF